MRIIPAIDLKDGHCVRLYQGDFDRETRYGDDPLAVADDYRGFGFSELHVVDLDGARDGSPGNRDLVARLVADAGFAVQVGGGIRNRATAERWLDAGVARVVIGSVAVAEPRRVMRWMRTLGAERFVLALDVRCVDDGTPMLATHGWTRDSGVSLWDCLEAFADSGLGQVLCTDVGRDGALVGPALDLYTEFVARHPELALQASGGVSSIGDLAALRDCGAAAAITGRALLDGRIRREEVASFRQSA